MTQPPQELLDFGKARAAFWANPPRGRCAEPECTEGDSVVLHAGSDGVQRCATHATRLLNRKHDYPCDNDPTHGPAFRDPAHRLDIMLCAACHEADGYVPGDRALVSQLVVRQGVEHPMARKVKCIAAGKGTECKGEIKQRGQVGTVCNGHWNPGLFK